MGEREKSKKESDEGMSEVAGYGARRSANLKRGTNWVESLCSKQHGGFLKQNYSYSCDGRGSTSLNIYP